MARGEIREQHERLLSRFRSGTEWTAVDREQLAGSFLLEAEPEQFEGGELRFPEFGDQRYRPANGTAIVFSSSLLHEALHVTSGGGKGCWFHAFFAALGRKRQQC